MLDPLLPSVDGVHETPVNCAGAFSVSENICELPLSDATICAARFEPMLATVAVKVPVVCPDPTVTLAGTVTLGLLLDKLALTPPAGAGADSVTVQDAKPGALTLEGVQLSRDGITVTVRLILADCCTALSVAVTLAVCAVLTVPVVATNDPLDWPEATVTLPGTVSAVVLLDRFTLVAVPAA